MGDSSLLVTSNLSEQIHSHVRDRILAGAYAPGDKLSEVALANAFGVSRAPVREALRMLVADGIAVQQPRKGVFVPHFDPASAWDVFELREALETMAARLAAQRASETALAKLRDLVIRAGEAISANDGAYPSEYDFHAAVAEAAGNVLLADKIREADARIRLGRLVGGMSHDRATDAISEHLQIVSAIEARDADRAEVAMRAHLQHAYDHAQNISYPRQ